MSKKTPSIATKNVPHDPFSSFREEMNRIFNDNFGAWGGLTRGSDKALAPSLDIKESDKDYRIVAELPGVSEKDIELEISNRVLSIRGEKREEKNEKGDKGYHVMERRYGSFLRSITLPDDVEESKIEAHVSDGLLTITLPKSKDASAGKKKIAVKSGK
jgi:HSP20 family protein